MSIPLDKLYHYIEGIAQDIRGDNILIYRFFPHGSKKLEDLVQLHDYYPRLSWAIQNTRPQIFCNDQEPLNYDSYVKGFCDHLPYWKSVNKYFKNLLDLNLRQAYHRSIYDKYILIHSEQRSKNVSKYRKNNCIPVYYWSHGLIALDWFRFAQHDIFVKNVTKKFLIYSRAWSGTREYRLKFADLLIEHNLVDFCQITVNSVDPELGSHHTDYEYVNPVWKPIHKIEDHIDSNKAPSTASADYDKHDYNSTEIEVVLETLFDDPRLHLTEKVLRPIALGQPFLLAATHGSLEYLRSYGFKTFSDVIDETYDTIEDPLDRLCAVVNSMKEISLWGEQERKTKMLVLNQIAEYNRKHFFSNDYFKQIIDELKINLTNGLAELESTNTSKVWLHRRELYKSVPELEYYVDRHPFFGKAPQHEIDYVYNKANEYYIRTLSEQIP